VAVILDGNRRWASLSGLREPGAGHRAGADKLDELIDWCARLRIEQVTVWALAGENRARTGEELAALLAVIADKLDLLAALHAEQSVRIRVLGRHGELPDRLQRSIEAVERVTTENEGLRLNIAIGYSGRDEVIDAVRALVRGLAESGYPSIEMADVITADALEQHLYTAGEPDPDLIIRTSGEQRLSGFLLWQGTHSELYFTDVFCRRFASSISCVPCAASSSASADSAASSAVKGESASLGGERRPATRSSGVVTSLIERAPPRRASPRGALQSSPYSSRRRGGSSAAVQRRCAGAIKRSGAGRDDARKITSATSRAGSVTQICELASCSLRYTRKPANVGGMISSGVPKIRATSAMSR